MTDEKTKTMVNTKNKKEAEEVLDFLAMLSQSERIEFLGYIRGAKLCKEYKKSQPQTA